MKDYKRLTERKGEDIAIDLNACGITDIKDFAHDKLIKEIATRLADLEDKIENGTLIELPCKVGQPIWIVCYELWTTKPFVDKSFIKSFEQIAMIMEHGEIGKTVFLTKAEAEAKVRELKGE